MNMTPPVGIHILSSLYACEKVSSLDKETLSAKITQLLHDNQLTKLGEFFHEFFRAAALAVDILTDKAVLFHRCEFLLQFVCNQCKPSPLA
jgi:S-adenosylmethionine/arginine decarboxylase-like enzyme